jgi:hypothetical protein
MDRIFLAVIVSGLLLAATSTTLLVVSSGEPLIVSAMNLPVSARDGRPARNRLEQETLIRAGAARDQQTSF